MNPFFKQAKHNSEFLKCINDKFPDLFYDWKITVLFYISIHLLKCLSHKRGIRIGDTHYEIEYSLNPKKCQKQVFPFPEWTWKTYSRIFKYSKDSRYDGIDDELIVLMAQRKNFEECVKLFDSFKLCMASQDIAID